MQAMNVAHRPVTGRAGAKIVAAANARSHAACRAPHREVSVRELPSTRPDSTLSRGSLASQYSPPHVHSPPVAESALLRAPSEHIACLSRRRWVPGLSARDQAVLINWYSPQFENNHFTEMCCGTEAGAYLRLIDSCLTQRKAQGPSRTCNESKEKEEEEDQAKRAQISATNRSSPCCVSCVPHSKIRNGKNGEV